MICLWVHGSRDSDVIGWWLMVSGGIRRFGSGRSECLVYILFKMNGSSSESLSSIPQDWICCLASELDNHLWLIVWQAPFAQSRRCCDLAPLTTAMAIIQSKITPDFHVSKGENVKKTFVRKRGFLFLLEQDDNEICKSYIFNRQSLAWWIAVWVEVSLLKVWSKTSSYDVEGVAQTARWRGLSPPSRPERQKRRKVA
jgi:hypothetical protein